MTSLTLNSANRNIAAITEDRVVRVWNSEAGDELFAIANLEAAPSSITFCGNDLIIGQSDGTLIRCHAETGEQIATLGGHTGRITVLSANTRADRFASGDEEGDVKIWDANSNQPIDEFVSSESGVSGIAFGPNGRQVAVFSAEGELRIRRGDETSKIRAGRIQTAAFDRTGLQLITAGFDGSLRHRDVVSGEVLATKPYAFYRTSSAAICANGNSFASATSAGSVRIWTTNDHVFNHGGRLKNMVMSNDGTRLASVSEESVKFWDAENGAELMSFAGRIRHPKLTPSYDNASQRLIVDNEVWNIKNRRRLFQFEEHGLALTLFRPGGEQFLCISTDGRMTYRDAKTGHLIQSQKTNQMISAASFRGDGKRLATLGEEGPAVWDARSGDLINDFDEQFEATSSLAFGPELGQLVLGGNDGVIRIVDIESGNLLKEFSRPKLREADSGPLKISVDNSPVLSLCVASDHQRVASASRDGLVIIWDISIGDSLHTFRMPKNTTTPTVQFDESGTQLHFAGEHYAGVYGQSWDANTGEEIASVGASTEDWTLEDTSQTVSLDHPIRDWDLATGNIDQYDEASKRLIVNNEMWDIENRRRLFRFDEPNLAFTVFGPLGRQFLTVSTNGSVALRDAKTNRPNRTGGFDWFENISAACFRSDGKFFAILSESGPGIFDAINPDSLSVDFDRSSRFRDTTSIAFGPEIGQFVLGGHDGIIRIVDIESEKILKELLPPKLKIGDNVFSVCADPKHQLVASASRDQSNCTPSWCWPKPTVFGAPHSGQAFVADSAFTIWTKHECDNDHYQRVVAGGVEFKLRAANNSAASFCYAVLIAVRLEWR